MQKGTVPCQRAPTPAVPAQLFQRTSFVFRSPRSLLVLCLFAGIMALLVFGRDPSDGGRAVDNRGFLSACEKSDVVAASGPDLAEAARLCSCILSWHLKEGEKVGYPLPASLYQPATPTGPGSEVSSLARSVDSRAREACRSGRMPR